MTILVCGIPSERPLRLVLDRLEASGSDFVVFNQRRFDAYAFDFQVADGTVDGNLRLDERELPLSRIRSVFLRLMDDRYLPELDDDPQDSTRRRRCRHLHETLLRWADVAPQLVINRPAAMASNISKSYQAQLIRELGFRIPETLLTNDPALVRQFVEEHGEVIYKSVSAVRSIVRRMEDSDFDRLERIRWCPTQFQAYIPGTDVRVHVVGKHVFATAIESAATDYRYATHQVGRNAELREVELSPELAERCVALAEGLGLVFAGIDLKVTANDEVFCFEVNTSPAFSYYEAHTGQPIASAVADCLMNPDRASGRWS